jgi:hypothetical protein
LQSEELPGRAAAALEQGLDSSSLRVLAGLKDPIGSDLERIVDRVAAELELKLPESKRDAVLLAARGIAQRILSGEMTPSDGARRIWSLWIDDYPEELLLFVGAASQLDDYVAERVRDPKTYDRWISEVEADIVEGARNLVRNVAA